MVKESYYTRHVYVRGCIWPFCTLRRLRSVIVLGSLRVPGAFFVKQPKAAAPRYRFRVRAPISCCAPSPCYGIACTCTLLHRVLLVTAPTKDPSIFPQSRRKFSRRAPVLLISLIVPGASFVPGTIIAGYIKSLYTR